MMRRIGYNFLALVAILSCACAQKKTDLTEIHPKVVVHGSRAASYYVFIYRPGPAWVEGKSIRKQPIIAHATYMNKLEREGTLLLGGPFKDDAGAFGILQCESIDAAWKLIEADPAIRDQIMIAQVHPWFSAAPGCLERRPW